MKGLDLGNLFTTRVLRLMLISLRHADSESPG